MASLKFCPQSLDGKKVYGDNEPEKMKELLDLSNARPIEINYKVIVNDDAPNNSLTESRPVGQVAGANQPGTNNLC